MNIEIEAPEITLPRCDPIMDLWPLSSDDENARKAAEAEWHALRLTGIGGSDAGPAMDMSKYGSPLTVVLEKTGRLKPEDIGEREEVKMGNILEPLIRDNIVAPLIKEELGIDVEVIPPAHMYRSRKFQWMIINPDGFLRIPGNRLVGLEIKTGSSHVLKNWGGRDGEEIPDTYYCQVEHYLAGTGLDEWWTVGLIGNQRVLRIIPRNEEFISRLIEREKLLWETIERNDPLLFPLPNGSDADMDAIMALGSPQDDSTVDLTELDRHITEYIRLGYDIKEQDAERKRVKQEILIAMGTSKYGESERYRVSFSRFMKSRLDIDRLKKEHPALVESFTDYMEDGRMTVKERNDVDRWK